MKNFNPFICVLDHILYTFPYVRQRSSFLLTVILAAAAKAFNPALHEELNKHSEALLLKAFSRGPKSAETIQAILLKTYWKQPDDTRSWPIMGYVIRLCMEQGWHKLTLVSPEEDAKLSAVASRQRRNVERMWLILFVYDRR